MTNFLFFPLVGFFFVDDFETLSSHELSRLPRLWTKKAVAKINRLHSRRQLSSTLDRFCVCVCVCIAHAIDCSLIVINFIFIRQHLRHCCRCTLCVCEESSLRALLLFPMIPVFWHPRIQEKILRSYVDDFVEGSSFVLFVCVCARLASSFSLRLKNELNDDKSKFAWTIVCGFFLFWISKMN